MLLETNGRQMGLGAALAYIKLNKYPNKIKGKELSDQDIKYIQSLRTRYEYLLTRGSVEKVFQSIPKYSCESTSQYLAGNVDFFISYVLLSDEQELLEKFSTSILKHLNDCFWCFDYFTDVMREFYQTTQKFFDSRNGGK